MPLPNLTIYLASFLMSLILSSLHFLPAASVICDSTDKITLLKFKQSFGSPAAFSSWNPKTDCCSWKGVLCEMFTGQVLGLTIYKSNISGPIPSIIGDFPVLSYIDFQYLPYLAGPIPSSITKLTLLKQLIITNTGLSGSIPSFLGDLKQLSQVNLSSNKLAGPIPDTLRETFFDIDFSRNQLSGPIPASLYSGTQSNPRLNLSHNQLTGQIPRELGRINFWLIDLAHNRLTGDASFFFGATKWASDVNLSDNELDFDLSLVRFSDSLMSLDLSHNKIRGGISRQITSATKLVKLDLSYNRLCGRIPSGGKMRRFNQTSYLHNKCLCGTPLPRCP